MNKDLFVKTLIIFAELVILKNYRAKGHIDEKLVFKYSVFIMLLHKFGW